MPYLSLRPEFIPAFTTKYFSFQNTLLGMIFRYGRENLKISEVYVYSLTKIKVQRSIDSSEQAQ